MVGSFVKIAEGQKGIVGRYKTSYLSLGSPTRTAPFESYMPHRLRVLIVGPA